MDSKPPGAHRTNSTAKRKGGWPLAPHESNPVILFDGVCNLCNGTVRFIIKRDKTRHFRFGSLQSEAGRRLMEQRFPGTADRLDSIVLIEGDRTYTHSDAVLRILRRLGPGWAFLSLLRVIPRFFRDFVYRRIAGNRYRWFGKQETCMVPSPELKFLFIDEHF